MSDLTIRLISPADADRGDHLKIAGRWQDHYLYQLLSENWLARRTDAP